MMKALLTPAEVAAKLRCSKKTLAAHVRAGSIRYIIIGHGTKRPRRAFTEVDVEEFIERQTRRDLPVQGIIPTRRSTASARAGEVLGFMALREKLKAKRL